VYMFPNPKMASGKPSIPYGGRFVKYEFLH
jgi:hypothetical protein